MFNSNMLTKSQCFRRCNIVLITTFLLCMAKLMPIESSEFDVVVKDEIKKTSDTQKIYTYIHDHSTADVKLLRLWKDSWRDAGWDPEVLTPLNAKSHSKYIKLSGFLKKAEMSSKDSYNSYIGHLAMATIASGGYYSELYTLPLNPPTLNTAISENDEKITSYDVFFSSVMSGSYKAWNQLNDELIELFEKKVESNDFVRLFSYSLRQLVPSGFVNLKSSVISPHIILSPKQFDLTNICDTMKDKFAIQFHLSVLEGYDYNKTSRVAMMESWMKVFKARCLSNRPVIFTFYIPFKEEKKMDSLGMLNLWTDSWSNAGWEPVVLTRQDAKRHPRYVEFARTLNSGLMFKEEQDIEEFDTYMRWVAVAASGGGWFANYDVIPLNIKPYFSLPNGGRFTGHHWTNPTYMSGSVSEWYRITDFIFFSFSRNRDKTHWSDALAFQDVYSQAAFNPERNVKPINELYTKELQTKSFTSDNFYDLVERCHLLRKENVVHFSSSGCDVVKFCNDTRALAARKWYNSWLQQCYNTGE